MTTTSTGTTRRRGVAAGTAALRHAMSAAARPQLVLLPGLHGTCALMQDFVAALAADAGGPLDALAIDYPRDRVLDYAALADFVRPTLPRHRPFVLLGESFSGPVAIRLAAEHPHGLRGVVLSTTFAANPRPALAPFAGLARALPPSAIPMPVFAFWLLGRWANPHLRAEFARVLGEVEGEVLAERLVACLRVDVRDRLAAIDVPLLYLRGTADRLVPRRACDIVLRAVKAPALVELHGPHCLLQALAGQAAQAVRRFVAGL